MDVDLCVVRVDITPSSALGVVVQKVRKVARSKKVDWTRTNIQFDLIFNTFNHVLSCVTLRKHPFMAFFR